MLSSRELEHFDTFGFVVLRGLLRPDEVRALEAELEAELSRAYGAFDGTTRHWALMSTPRTPTFAALLEDPRFFGVADQALRGESIGIASDASRFVGDTLWHADTVGPAQWGVKFLFYFEPLRAGSGALRVIPGSHRQPLHDAASRFVRDSTGDSAVPAYVFDAEPGDVIAYDVRLLHASFGGPAGRRGASVFYFHDPQTPEQDAALREQDRLSRAHVRDFRRAVGARVEVDPMQQSPLLDPEWVSDPAMAPLRRRWIDRLRALGMLDPVRAPLDERHRLPHRPPPHSGSGEPKR